MSNLSATARRSVSFLSRPKCQKMLLRIFDVCSLLSIRRDEKRENTVENTFQPSVVVRISDIEAQQTPWHLIDRFAKDLTISSPKCFAAKTGVCHRLGTPLTASH